MEVPKIGLSLASQVATDMMSQQQKPTSSSDVSLTRVLPPPCSPASSLLAPHHLELLSLCPVHLVFGSIHFNTDICNIYHVHNIYVLLSLFHHQCSGRFVGTIGKKNPSVYKPSWFFLH